LGISSVTEEVLSSVGVAEGLNVSFVEIPMGLAVGDIDGLCVIVVVRPGILVELSPPLKGGEIVVVGATVGMLGLNSDDDLMETGAPVGGNT